MEEDQKLPELHRPTQINLTFWNRDTNNKILFAIYKVIRILHVTIWFYPFPLLVTIGMYYRTFWASLKQQDTES